MEWWRIALIVVISYLLGSINSSILVSRTFHKVDIRQYGSGNAGSTNAFRVMGKKWAIPVVLFDLLKGALAVWFGYLMLSGAGEGNLGKLIAGVAAIVGHIFPVFFEFRGGKGVMTTAAIVALVDWRAFLIVMGVFLIATLLTRWVSLGSILAAAGIPVAMYVFHAGGGRETAIFVAVSAVISLIVIIMHRENIKRILAGTERRFSFKGRALLDTIKTKGETVKTRTVSIKNKTASGIKKTTARLNPRRRKKKNRRRSKTRRPIKT